MSIIDHSPARTDTPGIDHNRLVIYLAVGLSAIGGAVCGAHPTGLDGLDRLVIAAVAAGTTGLSSRARPWAWTGAAAIALIGASQNALLFLVAALVFAVAVATSVFDVDNRNLGTVIGAVTVQVLLRLPSFGPFGVPSLLAAAALGLIVISGLRNSTRRTRRGLLYGAFALVGLATVATVLFGAAVLRARDDLDAGIAAAKEGLSAARAGNTEAAAGLFDRARLRLASASDTLDAYWARAARVVPIVGQHEEALRTLTADAVRLTTTGERAAREADVETLRLNKGRLDLARVVAMRAPLHRVEAALSVTRADLVSLDSNWLLAAVHDRLVHFDDKVVKAIGSARTASLGIDATPRLLGRTRPTRFLLMFTTPSEARGSGFMGNWAILTITDGKLNLTRFGRTTALNAMGDPASRKITEPKDYLARYGPYHPELDWRSVTMSPDFPTVARVARELAPESGLGNIDGVVAIDPVGIAALLKLTGPVAVAGRSEPLTARNAAEFLLRAQYESFANPQRIDYLEEAARAVTTRLTTGSLPGPRALGKALAPAARDGHLLLQAFDPTSERLFARLGVSGQLAPPAGDYLGLVTQNASGNKIELFLNRSVRYNVSVDPSLATERASAVITLVNRAPASGLPPIVIASPDPNVATGANRSVVSFYTYLTLDHATVQGQPIELTGQTERGVNVYTTALTIPSGATATLRLELRGAARLVRTAGQPEVRLTVGHQVMPNRDHVRIQVRVKRGWSLRTNTPLRASGSEAATWSGTINQRTTLAVSLGG